MSTSLGKHSHPYSTCLGLCNNPVYRTFYRPMIPVSGTCKKSAATWAPCVLSWEQLRRFRRMQELSETQGVTELCGSQVRAMFTYPEQNWNPSLKRSHTSPTFLTSNVTTLLSWYPGEKYASCTQLVCAVHFSVGKRCWGFSQTLSCVPGARAIFHLLCPTSTCPPTSPTLLLLTPGGHTLLRLHPPEKCAGCIQPGHVMCLFLESSCQRLRQTLSYVALK